MDDISLWGYFSLTLNAFGTAVYLATGHLGWAGIFFFFFAVNVIVRL